MTMVPPGDFGSWIGGKLFCQASPSLAGAWIEISPVPWLWDGERSRPPFAESAGRNVVMVMATWLGWASPLSRGCG